MSLMFGKIAEEYSNGKIHLKSGFVIKGKNMLVSQKDVTIFYEGHHMTYDLKDIKFVYAANISNSRFIYGVIGGGVISTIALIPELNNDGKFYWFFIPFSIISAYTLPQLFGVNWELIYWNT